MRSDSWTTYKLGEIFDLINGYAFKGSEFKDGGVPVLKIKNVKPNKILLDDLAYVEDVVANKRPDKQVLPGDILITMSGNRMDGSKDTWVGKVAYFDLPGRYMLNQRVGILRPKKDTSVDLRCCSYFLSSEDFQKFFISIATSSGGQANLSPTQILGEEIKLPTLGEQKEISELLGALDGRITLLRETNATLEAIAQALFKSWFVDFDPVRAKMEGRAPVGMDEATAALFPDSFEETELGVVPRGWRVELLEKWLAVLETGRRPKGGVSGIDSGVPSIGAESVVRMGEFDFCKTKFVSTDFFQKMKSGALQSHDVLLYKDGGKPGVFLPRVSMFGDGFPFEVCGINEHVFRMRLKEPFGQVFLYFWLWSDAVMHELKHRGGKAAIPGINQSDVKELKILRADEHILSLYEELALPLVTSVFNNAKQIQALSSLRDTLLPRLISGQLRLTEAQTMLEEALT